MKNIILFAPRFVVVAIVTTLCFAYWLLWNGWHLFWFNEVANQPFGWDEFFVDMWGWLAMGRFFIDFEKGRYSNHQLD